MDRRALALQRRLQLLACSPFLEVLCRQWHAEAEGCSLHPSQPYLQQMNCCQWE